MREQLFYIHIQKKKSKKKWKKKISKKNLSATFHIFSKCHFLSNGEGVSGHQAISGHPYQPTSNYRKNKKKKILKKKIQKKKFRKKKKILSFGKKGFGVHLEFFHYDLVA